MIESKLINFSQFYIREFFNRVHSSLPQKLATEETKLVRELIQHLGQQEQLTNAIARIAEEQGSGELSIFLFDIIDRIEDYSPSTAYQGLRETVNDFVTGLALMVEEESLRTAIKNVNSKFAAESKKEVTRIKKPAEAKKVKAEKQPSAAAALEPQKPEMVRDEINVEKFLEIEFSTQLREKLIDRFNTDQAAQLNKFVEIVIRNLKQPLPKDSPAALTDIFSQLGSAYPWIKEQKYQVTRYYQNLSSLTGKIIKTLEVLNTQHGPMIHDSVNGGKIVIAEIKKKKKFEKEEVSEQPTTIDTLLSEYFQSEVDEHIQQFTKIIADIIASPTEPKNLHVLAAQLQSFKEINMIHGYTVIEDFCTEIIAILNDGMRKKQVLNPESFQIFSTFFGLLKNTDKLRDVRQKSPQLEQLQQLPELFRDSLFVKKRRGEKAAAEPGIASELAPGAAEINREEIPFSNRSGMISLFSDVLQTVRSNLQDLLTVQASPPGAEPLLNKLISAAQLIREKEAAQFLDEFKNALVHLPVADPHYKATVLELLEIYDQVAQNLPVKVNWASLNKQLKQAAAETSSRAQAITAEAIASSDHSALNKILVDFEKTHLTTFADCLSKVFIEKNESERNKQVEHFVRLANNLKMLQAPKALVFADYYISLFKQEKQFNPDPIIFDEIRQVYKLFIQSLENKGLQQTDAAELISVLKEIIHPEKAETEPEVPVLPAAKIEAEPITARPLTPRPEELKAGDEEFEEDLEEIFKQEASKDLSKAEEALNSLESGEFNREKAGTIEKSLHSIKSSARLMGYDDVANLAAPIEEICEKMQSPAIIPDENLIPVFREVFAGLRRIINKQDADFSMLKMKLKTINLVEKTVPPATKETTASTAEKKIKTEEKPLFAAAGTDDEDLLQIFKEESAEYLRIIETAVATLRKEPNNPEALGQLEHASHSLKSAAKMLGFREIGQIGDGLEQVAESVQNGEITNEPAVIESIAAALKAIRNLTAGEKYDPDVISEVLYNLEMQNLKARQAGKPQAKVSQQPKSERFVLSNETELFLKEAWELIEKMNQDLVKLEKKPDDQALINDLCRHMHTLKGSAQIMQYENIGRLAHRMEDFFEKNKTSNPKELGESLDVIFKGVDEIQAMVAAVKAGQGDYSASYESTLADLNLMLGLPATVPVASAPTGQDIRSQFIDAKLIPFGAGDQEQVIKITTERLDKLVNMAAELVVNKAQFLNYLDSLRKIGNILEQGKLKLKSTSGSLENILEKPESTPAAGTEHTGKKTKQFAELTKTYKEFKEILDQLESASSDFNLLTRYVEQNISQISSLTKLLHDDILQVRMVPTEVLFNRFPRAVRDLARKQSKKVNLVIEGSDTEMDRAMVESLTDPLMHLIRNAIDHGIELPAARIEKGKSEDGIILLKDFREKNQVIIEVQDDGRGMDLPKIKAMIKKNNLATDQEITKMSESDLLFFVFYPGFSTRETATDISGRGVGLDVVAAQLRKVKGDIRISSKTDKGTLFSIRVPLTMAITPAVLVEQNQNVLAIPLTAVEETVQFNMDQVKQQTGKTHLTIRQESIPMVMLHNFLNYRQAPAKKTDRNICLVIREAGIKYALVVDKVLRREDIVVKSLGEPLSRLNFVAGGTILGDGSVGLVLDIPAITKKIQAEYYGGQQDFSAMDLARKKIQQRQKVAEPVKPSWIETPESEFAFLPISRKKITGRKAIALIVDDSISVRKFVSTVLERYNYVTVLASSGPEAITALKKSDFDIVITDLEMPEMHGFELIEKIRKNEKYKQLPIVILTGRAGEESREMGKRLGANEYIMKPFKEVDLLKSLEKFIEI